MRCLLSISPLAASVVYVDSGSTDGSVGVAMSLHAKVVALDMSQPFTAARARNAGLCRLHDELPAVKYVQFLDGDCEMVPGWLNKATEFLADNSRVAAVCGRRRERFPERSIYNRLCDLEWDTPVGQALACGGDVLMRACALAQVGGYRDDLIAGEEPELCVRLRANGWQVWRLEAEMTLHDAAMTRFSQWWKRSVRAGHAFAEGAHLHGAPPERHWVRESRSAWLWGLCLPAVLLLASAVWPKALVGFVIYPLQVLRLFLKGSGAPGTRLARAFFLVVGKFAEAMGQCRYVLQRVQGRPVRLIEYK